MKKEIEIKQFKKFLIKEVGKRCGDFCWDCFVCRSWRLYDDIESYLRFLKWIESDEIDIKKARKHHR